MAKPNQPQKPTSKSASQLAPTPPAVEKHRIYISGHFDTYDVQSRPYYRLYAKPGQQLGPNSGGWIDLDITLDHVNELIPIYTLSPVTAMHGLVLGTVTYDPAAPDSSLLIAWINNVTPGPVHFNEIGALIHLYFAENALK